MNNPILRSDFPDPDVIRVDDTYYLISTTMHFMPGAVILRSFDLVHWEYHATVFDRLEETPAQCLETGQIYGKGMWAASLRHHGGEFFVVFVANDTRKTYLYRAPDLTGPWTKSTIDGFYHDPSLLFDGGRAYLAWGNTEVWLTELNDELTGPRPQGLHRLLVKDVPGVRLGYEGAHLYKIRDHYYLFLIHWLPGDGRRVQACFWSTSLEGEFTGGDVLDDDMGYFNQGVAQGGVVDTPDGRWYAVLFQDQRALGRVPVVVPVTWDGPRPVFGVEGRVPHHLDVASTRPGHVYRSMVADGFAPDGRLHPAWQWNHLPHDALWSLAPQDALVLTSGRVVANVTQAWNVLTHRTVGPRCTARVDLNPELLGEGDYAGLCTLQGRWALIALTRQGGELFLVRLGAPGEARHRLDPAGDTEPGTEFDRVPWSGRATLVAEADFRGEADFARFFYCEAGQDRPLGPEHRLVFGLDHFVGCRFGLFVYSTQTAGGRATFQNFALEVDPSP